MLKDYLKEQILLNFGHKPTEQQHNVIEMLADFMLENGNDTVMLIRGFAGTGKTSLVSALVKTLRDIHKMALVAPTGRAAKVLSSWSDHPAYTIHKRIFRQKSIDKDSIFELNYNLQANILFICDEASMISNDNYLAGSPYGTGRLLDDLIHFIYNGKGCKLLLMGDTAQLPPVGEGESPALQDDVLRGYGLKVLSCTLTQVVRQQASSGILWNATNLRTIMDTEDIFDLPRIRFGGFSDVRSIPGNELIEALEQCYHNDGIDDTIVITRSNKRANIYNNGIRAQILWREEELSGGDSIMVVKNNYYWCEANKDANTGQANNNNPAQVSNDNPGQANDDDQATSQSGNSASDPALDFIANGDMAVVRRVRNIRKLYGFSFADATLAFPDYDDYEMQCTVLLDTLHTEAPALTHEQQEALYTKVLEDYEEINIAKPCERPQWKKATKPEKLKAMKQDPYFNALQIKYAYAITCHKAQGGQWCNVFIDQGYMTEDMLGPDYFRWLYTAITRATGTVYFVNWSKEQTEEVENSEFRIKN